MDIKFLYTIINFIILINFYLIVNIIYIYEISREVKKKIKDLWKDGENKKLDNGWLNLTVKDIPNKKININIYLFYDFFNDLINI